MRIVFLFFIFLILSQADDKIKSFLCGYKDILQVKENKMYFKDSSFLIYDDFKTKKDILNNADIEDMLSLPYSLHVRRDGGRIRNEEFFKKIYGKNKKEIISNLKIINWLPKNLNKLIKFNKQNNASNALEKVSNELDKLPKDYLKYLKKVTTFNYRNIANTSRLSTHSFAIAIDLNVKYANYWQWNKEYKNSYPKKIIQIFEKHGFIWGGRWEHFDTMHFEYRPEFTCKAINSYP